MTQPRRTEDLDRNLALDLVRVTEAAAMAAGRWVGRGDKEGGDGAAVDAMRKLINSMPMRGVVVIGEGEKDNAPMLFNGEQVGDGTGPEVDVAVDPIDGTTLMSKGMPNALAVLAVAERGAMFDPSAVFYMEKLAVGPDCADVIDINAGVAENLRRIAKVKRSSVSDVTVCILDRPRHADLVQRGPRRPAPGSSSSPTATSPARSAPPASESDVDVLMGIGGTPGGHHRRLRAQVHGRRDPGQAVAARRRRAGEGARRRARPGPGAAPPTTWSPATTLLRRHRRHLRRPAARRALPGRRRVHPVDRDAVQERHDPGHRLVPPPGEAGAATRWSTSTAHVPSESAYPRLRPSTSAVRSSSDVGFEPERVLRGRGVQHARVARTGTAPRELPRLGIEQATQPQHGTGHPPQPRRRAHRRARRSALASARSVSGGGVGTCQARPSARSSVPSAASMRTDVTGEGELCGTSRFAGTDARFPREPPEPPSS